MYSHDNIECYDNLIYVDVDDSLLINGQPNEKLVQKIMEWSMAGRKIIVWTSNPLGVKHALDAVKKCDLYYYVDLCLVKPQTIVDDDHLEYYSIIDPITLNFK
jgi:hypothetical protein